MLSLFFLFFLFSDPLPCLLRLPAIPMFRNYKVKTGPENGNVLILQENHRLFPVTAPAF